MAFLARNRLIAAIGDAVVVVEAGARSGALNTAHHAAQLGRPVFAVPGRFTSPASVGCHRLVAEGVAELAATPRDPIRAAIAGHTGLLPDEPALLSSAVDDPDVLRVVDALGRRAVTVTEVAERSGLAIAAATDALALAELQGLVRRQPDGWNVVHHPGVAGRGRDGTSWVRCACRTPTLSGMERDAALLEVAVDGFLLHAVHGRGLSEQTVRAYRGDLEDLRHFAATRGVHRVDALSLEVLRDWLWRRTSGGWPGRASRGGPPQHGPSPGGRVSPDRWRRIPRPPASSEGRGAPAPGRHRGPSARAARRLGRPCEHRRPRSAPRPRASSNCSTPRPSG